MSTTLGQKCLYLDWIKVIDQNHFVLTCSDSCHFLTETISIHFEQSEEQSEAIQRFFAYVPVVIYTAQELLWYF